MLRLGNLELAQPFFQAAMSGYSDRPMRVLAREHGAPLVFSGVMLDKFTLHPAILTKSAFTVADDEHPVGGQILGTEPKMMAYAARSLEQIGYDLIDLNFACPVPKVLRRGRGGYMLNRPKEVREIYRRVREAVSCPVLMKLRIGFDKGQEDRDNFWQICRDAATEGIDGLIVHGRTVQEKYSGRADWEILAQLKGQLPDTVVIGSGDLLTAAKAVEQFKTSGLDGVVIARGAIGNPWIFQEMAALLDGNGKLLAPSLAEQGQTILRHFEMVVDQYGPSKAVGFFRKFSVKYCRRHPQRKKVQMQLLAARETDEVRQLLKQWYN